MSMTDNSYEDLSALLGGFEDASSGPINTLQKMLAISGNPLFLYMQGVISSNDLRSAVQAATYEPVDISNADYRSIEENDSSDPVLANAYQMIKQGVSVTTVMASILRSYDTKDPNSAAKMNKDLEYIQDSVENFKDSWDAAQKIEAGVNSGEYTINGDGTVSKKMDPTKGADVLKQMGMPGILQNTFIWDVIPDADLLASAATKQDEAQKILSPFAKMINPVTGMLVQKEAQKLAKEATATAKSVYESIMNQTKEGRRYIEGTTSTIFDPTISSRAAANPPVAPTSVQKSGLDPRYVDPNKQATDQKAAAARVDVLGANPDYWAKLGASYAGRAAIEEKKKPIEKAKKDSARASAEAQELARRAMAKGTVPALSFLERALPFAAMLSQSGGSSGGGGGRSAPPPMRTLSDQEIDAMSSMMARGS